MNTPLPRWWLAISVVLLIWNLAGIGAFISQWRMTPADILLLPSIEQDLWKHMSPWVWMAYAIAVTTGCLGAVALLLRKKWALPLYCVSLVAVIVQFSNVYLLQVASLHGISIMVFPLFIIVMTALQVLLSYHARRQSWLN